MEGMIWQLRSCAFLHSNAHFFQRIPGPGANAMVRFCQRESSIVQLRGGDGSVEGSRKRHLTDYEERLCACGARADSNLLMNRLAHHLQYPIRNFSHAVGCRDVIRDFGHDLLFGVAAGLELAPGNEVVAVKDFCHRAPPNEAQHGISAGSYEGC